MDQSKGTSTGWIKLFRSFKSWEWYNDKNTKELFIHLLLSVNFEDKKWKGMDVKRGELVTSLSKLSKEIGLSIQQVRTSINKLNATHEITSTTTSKYTLISVVNYSNYQDADSDDNKVDNIQGNNQATNNQHSDNTVNDEKSTNNQQDLKPHSYAENKELATNEATRNQHSDKLLNSEKVTTTKERRTNNNNSTIVEQIVEYLNEKASKKYRSSTKATHKFIQARLNEGFTLEDLKKVVDIKTAEWKNDSKMNQYLRPSTLFGSNFEGYLNQNGATKEKNANGSHKGGGYSREEYLKAYYGNDWNKHL